MFLIRALDAGGAQRQLVEFVKGLDKNRFSAAVVTFYDGGAFRSEIERLENVSVFSLSKQSRWDVLSFTSRLWHVTQKFRPNLVYGYMGVANELALAAGRLQKAKVVWGLRSSYVDFSHYDWASRLAFWAGAWLSPCPDLIIVNSQAGKRHHLTCGYSGARMIVIPNGIDTGRFQPDQEAGCRARAEWGIKPDEPLIGVAGRLDPMKDYPTFLEAAAQLASLRPDVRFVCVGDGPTAYRAELRALSASLGLQDRLVWAGARNDMTAVYNAFDLAALPSIGESFPNVICEAMACGVPCVATDVGDCADIVGKTGCVVPPKDPAALAGALARMLALAVEERRALGAAARERIIQEFSAQRLASATMEALLRLVGSHG